MNPPAFLTFGISGCSFLIIVLESLLIFCFVPKNHRYVDDRRDKDSNKFVSSTTNDTSRYYRENDTASTTNNSTNYSRENNANTTINYVTNFQSHDVIHHQNIHVISYIIDYDSWNGWGNTIHTKTYNRSSDNC